VYPQVNWRSAIFQLEFLSYLAKIRTRATTQVTKRLNNISAELGFIYIYIYIYIYVRMHVMFIKGRLKINN
jgi:hypothetical protein